jgi:hypothetical protein
LSRGPGSLQQIIFDRVSAAGTICLNRLLWDVALERRAARPSVTDSFNSGFRRSVRRLVEEGHIRPERRRLTDIDDLIECYPYKSRDADVKSVRFQLLPVAKAYLGWRQVRKYSPADNERYLYRDLSEDVRAEAEARWRNVEPVLFAALTSGGDHVREAVFDVLVRGQQLFGRRPMLHRAPLTVLLDQVIALASDSLPAEAVADLRHLAAIFPAPVLARLKLKSDLYEIAQLGRDHSQHIKDDFIQYAMRTMPDVMRSMPGFKPARFERVAKLSLPFKEEVSPLVHKLLRRDALAPFEFLSLRQGSRRPQTDTQIVVGAGMPS